MSARKVEVGSMDAKSLYDFTVKDIDGKDVPLSEYKGRVCYIVNVACECGYTKSNYQQVAQLHEKYSPKGLSILAFPCNQFQSQEPGTNEEIKKFAQEEHNAKYDLFAKINVNGDEASPLYKWLKKELSLEAIKWNFGKFLVDKQGAVKAHFDSGVEPMSDEMTAKIEELLK